MDVLRPAEQSTPTLPKMLVVDDDPLNIEMLRRMFEASYAVSTARSGAEALDLLSAVEYSFDIMLLDIMMPGMSGIDVLKRIRESHDQTALPILMISALADSRDVVTALRLGANDYITKPVDVALARARVDTQMSLKRLMDERAETIVELREMQKVQEHFFKIASHDLKSPLSNVRMAQMLLRDIFADREDIMLIVNTVGTTLDNMDEIIEDFIDTIILRTKPGNLTLECINFPEMIWDVVMQYNLSAARKDISVQLGDVDGLIYADAGRLRQILTNLVSNAIKYSPPATVVTIWSEVKGDTVCINIADQGPGIPERERDKLFSEFGKLSTRPTAGEGSTGLGLWIVKHLATLMNGTVGVNANPGGGSIFWVELPRCVPQ